MLEDGVPKLQEIKSTQKIPTINSAVGSGDRWWTELYEAHNYTVWTEWQIY